MIKKIIIQIIYKISIIYGYVCYFLWGHGYIIYILSLIRGGRISILAKKAGKHILLGKNVHLRGIKFVSVGSSVTFGEYSIITAYKSIDKVPKLNFGNNCNIGPYNHITCINEIKIGDGFLSGRWVTITDNSHGSNTFSEQLIPPGERSLFSKGAIVIGKNVWIGDKATILPGVNVGDGVIIGANSVVTEDIPSNCIACGNPAKIVKQIK